MINKIVYLASLDTGALELGRVGENNHYKFIIVCDSVFADHPNATVSMKVKAPDGTVYPREVTVDGNNVEWTIVASDVATSGGGQVQLTFTDSAEVIKTVVANTTVLPSLVGNDPPPSPIEDWIEDADETLALIDFLADIKVRSVVIVYN